MGVAQRFLTSFLKEVTDAPGLVMDPDGSIYVVGPTGTRTKITELVGAMGPAGPPGPSNTLYPPDSGVRWIGPAGIGSNKNDGLSPMGAMLSPQAAYDSFDARGGTIFALRGIYDFDTLPNGYLLLSATKPCVITSPSGVRAMMQAKGGAIYDGPIFKGSNEVLCIINTGYGIGFGMAFRGVHWDMRTKSCLTGILSRDMNYLSVKDCSFEGGGQANSFAIRSQEIHPGWADSMIYRIEDNYCRAISLFRGLADDVIEGVVPLYPPGGNLNNIQITNNVVFGNPGYAIDVYNLQRSVFQGNNLEGGEKGIILRGTSKKNAILWQGGEGTTSPYLEFDAPPGSAGSYGNWYQNFALDGGVAVLDEAGLGTYAAQNYRLSAQPTAGYSVKTDDYILAAGNWNNHTFFMDKATALSFHLSYQLDTGIAVGSSCLVVQAGKGPLTITKHGNVILNGPTATTYQGQTIRLIKTGIDTWYSHFG